MKRQAVYIIRIMMSRMSDNEKLLAILRMFDDMGNPIAGNLLAYWITSQECDYQSSEFTDKTVTYTFHKL